MINENMTLPWSLVSILTVEQSILALMDTEILFIIALQTISYSID